MLNLQIIKPGLRESESCTAQFPISITNFKLLKSQSSFLNYCASTLNKFLRIENKNLEMINSQSSFINNKSKTFPNSSTTVINNPSLINNRCGIVIYKSTLAECRRGVSICNSASGNKSWRSCDYKSSLEN